VEEYAMKIAVTATVEGWKKQLGQHFDSCPESLIPALQYVQESAGYLPRDAMTAVAEHLRVSQSKVFGVASFYSQFHMHPRGRHQITVCRGTACHVRGSARLLSDLEKMLGIQPGGSTSDMLFSLETVACLGSCALAPVVVKGKVYGRQTSASVKSLVDKIRASANSPKAGARIQDEVRSKSIPTAKGRSGRLKKA
jgi:NADH-quinone oxidoreductase subunit E